MPKFDRLINLSFELIDKPGTINKHFTFLLIRNNIISVGWSSLKTHTIANKYGYKWNTIHSELAAIKNCPFSPVEFNRIRLVNTRVNTKGEIQNSKPCKYCLSMLSTFNFKEVFYTLPNGEFEKL